MTFAERVSRSIRSLIASLFDRDRPSARCHTPSSRLQRWVESEGLPAWFCPRTSTPSDDRSRGACDRRRVIRCFAAGKYPDFDFSSLARACRETKQDRARRFRLNRVAIDSDRSIIAVTDSRDDVVGKLRFEFVRASSPLSAARERFHMSRSIGNAVQSAAMNDFWIAPSILAADFARLGDEVDAVLAAGADLIHFDVMDNHYVPNLSIGPLVLTSLRKHGLKAPVDVHLMVKPVDRLIGDFLDAGADYISIHPEATEHVHRSLGLIREGGARAGLVFNPATPLDHLSHVLDMVDLVLIMSVNPGFGGQQFIPSSLDKLGDAREIIAGSGRSIRLEIDGGIKPDNIAAAARAGADTFVAGSAIFGTSRLCRDDRLDETGACRLTRPCWRDNTAPISSISTARSSTPRRTSTARSMPRCSSGGYPEQSTSH